MPLSVPMKEAVFKFPTKYEDTGIEGDKLWNEMMPSAFSLLSSIPLITLIPNKLDLGSFECQTRGNTTCHKANQFRMTQTLARSTPSPSRISYTVWYLRPSSPPLALLYSHRSNRLTIPGRATRRDPQVREERQIPLRR